MRCPVLTSGVCDMRCPVLTAAIQETSYAFRALCLVLTHAMPLVGGREENQDRDEHVGGVWHKVASYLSRFLFIISPGLPYGIGERTWIVAVRVTY
eukprot:718518-Rhodomonas_salina.1